MVVKTDAGRAMDAKAVMDEFQADRLSYVMGMAHGVDWWGEEQFENLQFSNDELTLSHPVKLPTVQDKKPDLVVKSIDGATTYVSGADYDLDAATGKVTRRELGSIPSGDVRVQVRYTAAIPSPANDQTELQNLFGVVPLVGMNYVLPASEVNDPNATTIKVQDQNYVVVSEPSRLLIARATLPENYGVGEPIKAYGIFRGAKIRPGGEPGRPFFQVRDFESLGTLSHATHRSGVVHDGSLSFSATILLQY